MVARPPVIVSVERMTVDDLPAVQAIERSSFSTPWPPHAYRNELETNRLAHYLVARVDGQVVGFAGMWLMVDEAHITTFAVHPDWRRLGIGERMLLAVLELARTRSAREATLEVRQSNLAAQRLYEKFGFRTVGLRPRYYTDNYEDALIMTTDSLNGRQMVARIARLKEELEQRAEGAGEQDPASDKTAPELSGPVADPAVQAADRETPDARASRTSRIFRPHRISRGRP